MSELPVADSSETTTPQGSAEVDDVWLRPKASRINARFFCFGLKRSDLAGMARGGGVLQGVLFMFSRMYLTSRRALFFLSV
jgi:hypothetical protein